MGFNNALGQFGEDVAAAHLLGEGWTILDRNWRCRSGELDIIARDRRAVVFVEVKTRSGLGYGSPIEAITPVKAARLRSLALEWLAVRRIVAPSLRFDVICVLRTPAGVEVEHVRGAF